MPKKKADAVKLTTKWGEFVKKAPDKNRIWSEYPRPTLQREHWQCLNGLWRYAFVKEKKRPVVTEGEILVPFAPETCLSGVERKLLPGWYLWYERDVSFTAITRLRLKKGFRLLLHFGAVDERCEVYVDGVLAGTHRGGYLPFSFDITDLIKQEEGCEIGVLAEDVSDTSYHSVGKQTLKPGGMYYPATGGIWQTVWMEMVPPVHIVDLSWETFYDEGEMELQVNIASPLGEDAAGNACSIEISFLGGEYRTQRFSADGNIRISMPGFRSWSPEEPYLYRVTVVLYEENKEADRVESYFAMRKVSVDTDKQGIRRLFLNNRPYMQVGVLDQGYWPESLYTPPTEEAMIYDIETMKDLGFNMLRKHVKVEPERWYYHCDRLGMLVWQDMVNGGRKSKSFYVTYLATVLQGLGIRPSDKHRFLLSRQDKAGREEYEEELRELVCRMKSHPCVYCIVPFNEGWGQFDTNRMTDLIRSLHSGVLVDQASGWFDMGGGDIKSLHHYFLKLRYKREEERALALTEFGGYTNRVEGHTCHEKEYGYRVCKTTQELERAYEELLLGTVVPAVEGGISATVYTQLSDVEEEINGLLTYDRSVLKMDGELLRKWNLKLRDIVDKAQ